MERLKDLLLTNKLAKIAEILSVFIVAALIIWLFLKPADDNLIYNQIILWIANLSMLIMIWVLLKIRGESSKALGLNFSRPDLRTLFKTILRSILVFVLAMA